MSLIAPSKADLAVFTGRTVKSFGTYADQALMQATLMLKMVTGISDYPDDPDQKQVAFNAILEMADRLILEQPYAEVANRPFQSETIGSYSYSRTTPTTAKVQNGSKTGLWWWDMAMDLLMVHGQSVFASGSIKAELEELQVLDDGLTHVVDPADGQNDWPGYVRIS